MVYFVVVVVVVWGGGSLHVKAMGYQRLISVIMSQLEPYLSVVCNIHVTVHPIMFIHPCIN